MPGDDDDYVHARILEDALLIGRAVTKSKPPRRVLCVGTAGSTYARQLDTSGLPDSRQQRASRESPCAQQSNRQRFCSGTSGRTTASRELQATVLPGILGISDKDPEKGLTTVTGNEVIRRLGLLHGKTVGDQGGEIEPSLREEAEECLHVSGFCPAHIPNRVIDPPLLVGCVVAARSIGTRNAQIELLLVERPAVDLHAHGPNRCDHSAIAGNLSRQSERIIARRLRSNEDRIYTQAAGMLQAQLVKSRGRTAGCVGS